MTELVQATTPALVNAFVELPYTLYAGNPHWVPQLRRDEHRRLAPKHNPFWAHADGALWIARADGRTTGRIAAIEDRLHNEAHHERVTWFGFLEAEDAATARLLLDAVEAWARARGSAIVRGPANPSLNESAGLLVDGFDDDPYLLMPYNTPAYAGFIEGAGYAKVKDLLAWDIDATIPLGARMARLAERARQKKGIVLRTVDLKQFDRDLAIVQRIYNAAWANNWGFVPPTPEELRQLAVDLKPVLDPELIVFAELNGEAIGCAVAVPDVNQVLKKMNGRLLPFGLIHFLRRRSIVTRARVLLLGVVPEVRHTGLYPLLVADLHRRGVARGYTRAELSWTLEDNDAINAGLAAAGALRYKTYRLYEKKPFG